MVAQRTPGAGDAGLPPYVPSPDFDYTAAFGCLAAVQAKINCYGATPELVLRRGLALLSLGNYLGSANDAERVLQSDPSLLEAHWLHAQSCLALAAVRTGLLRPGLATGLPVSALPSRRELLQAAKDGFARILAVNPDDAQARKGLDAAERFRRGTSRATATAAG